MFYLIYKITNKANGKFYIGAHQTERKDDSYMGSGKAIVSAIKKYGFENFSKEILVECDSLEEMFACEKQLVVVGNTSYNLMEGGKGGWNSINEAGINGSKKGFWSLLFGLMFISFLDFRFALQSSVYLLEGSIFK